MIFVAIFASCLPWAWSKSCANLCGTNNAYSIVQDISCQCDLFCEQIGDCCEDYKDECGKMNQSQIANPTISCQKFRLLDSHQTIPLWPNNNAGVYMVSSCSAIYENLPLASKEIIQKCAVGSYIAKKKTNGDDLQLITPVVLESVTYVNIFCAICNAVDYGYVKYWNLVYSNYVPAGSPIEMIKIPPKFASLHLYRYPPQNHSDLYSVEGQSRLSKFCFKEVERQCPTNTCTPYVCEKIKSAGCDECIKKHGLFESCVSNYSSAQFLEAAKPHLGRGFFYDLTILFDSGNFITNVVNRLAGWTAEVTRTNCSNVEHQSDEICFPSMLDCLEISCTSTIMKKTSSMGTLILTLVGLCSSLISLILTLVLCWKTESFHAKTKHLQTQCFIAHIGAISSFIIAGSVSMRETADWLCKSAAILMQFSFLALFTWMHVMAWSLFMMIVGTKQFLVQRVVQSPKWVEIAVHYVFG